MTDHLEAGRGKERELLELGALTHHKVSRSEEKEEVYRGNLL